jgi:hypothetical protein
MIMMMLQECQKAQWKPLLHKLECGKLKDWANAARKAGLSSERQIPDTPIRAIGNMLLLKEHMPKDVSPFFSKESLRTVKLKLVPLSVRAFAVLARDRSYGW